MTDYTGTVPFPARWEAGQHFVNSGYYTLGGSVAQNDTFQFAGLIPNGGVRIDFVIINAPELDTNASPTATMIFGDGTDDDRFITSSSVGIAAASLTRVVLTDNAPYSLSGGTGAGYVYSATATLIAKINAAVATAASSGTITVKVGYTCVGNA